MSLGRRQYISSAAQSLENDSFVGAGGRQGAGLLASFWNITKMSIGIGMLSLPYAFKQAGYVIATVTLLFMGIVGAGAIMMLASAQNHVKKVLQTESVSYTDTVREILGMHWRNVAALFILLAQVGVSIGYEIFICNTFEHYFDLFSYNGWLIVLQVPLLIFCSFRSLRWLSVISFVGLLCLWFGTGVSMVLMAKDVFKEGLAPIEPITNIGSYALFFGLSALAFEGLAAAALTIEQSMAKPEKFPLIVYSCVTFIIFLEISFALLGTFSFGGHIDQIITRSFPKGTLASTASVLFSLELVFTFPGNLYPVWKFLEEVAFGPKPADQVIMGSPSLSQVIMHPSEPISRSRINKAFVRTLFRSGGVLLCALVALVCRDHFALFLSLVGSVACAAVLLFIPAVLQLHLVERYCLAWFNAFGLLILGILAPVAGIASALSGT